MSIKRTLTFSSFLSAFFISTLSAQFGEEIRLFESSYFTNMQIGDIDGDGRKDILSNEMHWYRQKEDETFEVGKYLGPEADQVNLHDLDENGTMDIIYNPAGKDSIFWWPNTGGGNFEPARFVGRLSNATLDFEDIDGDGDLDMFGRTTTVNTSWRTIAWFQNDGSENFTTFTDLTSSSTNNLIDDATLEDFDEDGDLDVFYTRSSKVYLVEHLDGQGTFANPQIWISVSNSTSHKIKQITFLDIDHDNKRDLLMFVDNNNQPLRWYRKTEDNNIDPNYIWVSGNNFTEGVFHLVDLNEDNITDILFHDDDDVLWLEGTSEGIYAQPKLFLDGNFTSIIMIDDIDNDGTNDVIFRQSNIVNRIRHKALQADPSIVEASFRRNDFLRLMDMGDINGDGLLDVVTQGDRILWQANLQGKPVFSESKLINSLTSNEVEIFNSAFIKLLDWDGDGDHDVLSGHSNSIYWYPNEDGLGDFGNGRQLVESVNNISSTFIGVHDGTMFGDIDLNGHLDFIGLSTSEAGLFYWRNDGSDHFNREEVGDFTFNSTTDKVKLNLVDVGGDNDQDIIMISRIFSGNSTILWIENIDGTLQTPDTIYSSNGVHFSYPFSSNLNQDGQTYIIYRESPDNDDIKALKFNNTDFENIGTIFSHTEDYEFIEAKDIDGDNDEDLIISFLDDKTIHWVENENGIFNNFHQLLDSVAIPRVSFYHEDISGDGLKDIVYLQGWDEHPFSNSFDNINAVVSYEQVDNTFQNSNRAYIISQGGVRFGTYIDMDRDGDLDYFGKQQDHFFWKENYDGAGHFSSEHKLGDIFYPENSNADMKVLFFDHGNDGDLDFIYDKKVFELENLQIVNEILIDDMFNNIEYFKASDLNGDGFEDLIGYKNGQDFIAYFEYLPGTGNYAQLNKIVENHPIPIKGLNTIDFDNDGDLDIFIGGGTPPVTINDESGQMYYMLNDGFANFSAPDTLLDHVSQRPNIAIGDINQDGTDDVVLALQYGNTFHYTFTLNWYSNIPGKDSLSAPTLIGSKDENSSSVAVRGRVMTNIFLTDFDGDGDLDVVTLTDWYENLDGLGNFSTAKTYNDLDLDELKAATQLQDIDGDGTPDILQPDGYKSNQTDNNGEPIDNIIQLLEVRNSQHAGIHYYDVDLDGDEDILISNGSNIFWYRNVPDSDFNVQFLDEGLLAQTPHNGGIKEMLSADMNGDGNLDLVVHYQNYIGWYESKGDGTMSNIIIADYSSNDAVVKVYLMDVDSDGDIDIVKSYDDNTIKINWIENMDGHGLFDVSEHIIYNPQSADPKVSLTAMADIDEDGDLDIIFNEETFGGTTTELYLLENIDGVFLSYINLMTINAPKLETIKPMDLDLDGDKDFFIVSRNLSSGINQFLYIQNNEGSYESLTWLESSDVDFYKLLDANNDYLPDLVLHYYNDEVLRWSLQDSIATFGPVEDIPMSNPIDFDRILKMDVHDFDKDFDLDIFYHVLDQSEGINTYSWRKNFIAQSVIRGQCFFDENQNAIKDSFERGLHNFSTILNPNSLFSLTDTLGVFKYFVDPGVYSLSYQAPPIWLLSTDSVTYEVNVDTASQAYDYFFGFYPEVDSLSIEPYLVSGPTRCNFEVPFWLNYHNTGTRIANGIIHLVKPFDVGYISASPAPDNINGDTLSWNFSDLYPFNSEEVDLVFKMPDEFSTGEFRDFETTVEVLDTLVDTVYVNQHIYSLIISCAIDPNDKLVNPNRMEDFPENYTLFGEYLEYTIRFQNTGNDTAFNVVVTDQLDTNLDWNSIRIIGASHNYIVSLDSVGLLTFKFNNIFLPDSTTNEILSHGYISYSISPLEGLDEMTIIENSASIFFDFNLPIITNTTENNLVSSLDFSDTLILSIIDISEVLCAGDSTATVLFDIMGGVGNYEVFLNGSFIFQAPQSSTTQLIDDLGAGNYTLMITDSVDHISSKSFTILEPDSLAISLISIIPESCTESGNISLVGIGGTPPYQYLWNDGTMDSLFIGTAGNYFLTITDNNSCVDTSSYELLLDCLDATKQAEEHGIKIYPNPLYNNDQIVIETPFVNYKLNFFNSLGQRILTENITTNKYTIRLPHFPEGLYWVVLFKGNERYIKQIIKVD